MSERFVGDLTGAGSLAAATASTIRGWGIWWSADRTERLAFAQASWLLSNDPRGGYLALHASYDSETMWLTVSVGDCGGVLPSPDTGEQWRLSIGARIRVYAELDAFSGRTLRCQFRIRAPWRTRLTWNRDLIQGIHPERTFENHYTEADVGCGIHNALSRIGPAERPGQIIAVHWQGPEDRDEIWHEVGTPSTGSRTPVTGSARMAPITNMGRHRD